jgi:hypothetical protein
MASSKRSFNWATVTFTPSGGTLTQLTGVTDVRVDPRGSVQSFSGDGDHFPTTKVSDYQDPMVTVTTADIAVARGLAPGTRGAFAATHLDAKNLGATGGGAYTVNLGNAIIVNTPFGGRHRQFGEATVNIECESTDGVTSPLTYTTV